MGMVWHGNINPLSYLPLKCQDSKLIQGGTPRRSTIFRDVALPRKPAWSNKAAMQATYSRDSFCSKTLGWFGWFKKKRDFTTHIYKDYNAPQYKDIPSTKSTKKDFMVHVTWGWAVSPKPPRNSRNSSPCKVPSRDRLVASWKAMKRKVFLRITWHALDKDAEHEHNQDDHLMYQKGVPNIFDAICPELSYFQEGASFTETTLPTSIKATRPRFLGFFHPYFGAQNPPFFHG